MAFSCHVIVVNNVSSVTDKIRPAFFAVGDEKKKG